MLTFDGPVEALNALQDFLIDRTAPLPARIRDRLKELVKERSPVVAVVRAIELIFAREDRKEDMPVELKDWAAAASAMTEDHGFHGMDQNSRGSRIAKVLRGETIAARNIPEPDEQAVLVADPPPPPPPEPELPPEPQPAPAPEPVADVIVSDADAPAIVDEPAPPQG